MGVAALRPDDLHKIAEAVEMAKLREALAQQRRAEEHEHQLRDAFMSAEVRPDAMEWLNRAVRHAAEQNHRELLVLRFPSDYCLDHGRAINNGEPGWPETLQGRAKQAYRFYEQHLKEAGYKARAAVLNYPEGLPGEVGLFLRW